MKSFISKILNTFLRLFKIQNKIVFESGRGLVDGNPKAVYEYFLKINQNKYRLMWLVEKGTDVSMLRKDDFCYYHTIRGYYHLATAKYWIRSQSMGSIVKKRPNQIYIQLWHGNGSFKYMGYDITNEEVRPQMEHTLEWDYYIAHSLLDVSHIKSSTGYNKKFDVLGMSCIDTTLSLAKDNKFKEELLNKLGLTDKVKNKKIILYAPTFRDFDLNKKVIDVPISKLSKLDDYIIMIRLHPLVRKKVNQKIFDNSNIINVCDYPDAGELLVISDILITDYSGIFYEFSPLNRPIIFYPYDYKKYCKLRGGFYLDYQKDLPGPICYKEDELIDTLTNLDDVYKKYKKKQMAFNAEENKYADGKAAMRFVTKLLDGKYEE